MIDNIIDISHWQGKIDFAKVRQSGVDAVFIKATQGDNYHDPQWSSYAFWASQNGLLFAPYHFMTDESVKAQFENIMRIVNPGDGAPIMLDFEDNPAGGTADADLVAKLGQMLEGVTGRKPLIYCGRYQIKTPHKWLSQCPLMLPQWSNKTPTCPPGWSTWLFHQYTDKGNVHGIAGGVDRSTFAGDAEQLHDWWQQGLLPGAEPAEEPDPAPPVLPSVVEAPKHKKKTEGPSTGELEEREVTRQLNKKELERVKMETSR